MNSVKEKINIFLHSKPGKILLTILSLIPAVAAVAIALYYIWGPGEGYLHADCTDTLYWANASVESGHVFDETYRYAGLLPFSAALWMIPLIKIFGFSMAAQNLGMSIFVILFACSVWFFCRSAKMGTGWCSAAVFAVMMTASSSEKLLEIMYGHTIYYSLSLPIMCFCLGFALRAFDCFERKSDIKGALWLVALAAMCAGAATDGGQVIVIGSLPAVAAIFAERIFCGKDRLFSRRSCNSWLALCAAATGTLAGIVLLSHWKGDTISSGYATAYSGWSEISTWVSNAQSFVKQWYTLMGVTLSKDGLFCKEAIPSIIRIFCSTVILLIPLLMLVFYGKLSSRGVKTALWGHLVISAAVMFGFICGKLSGANWRLTPIVCSAALLSLLGARELCVAGKNTSARQEAISEVENAACDGVAASRVLIRTGVLLTAVLCLMSVMVFNEIRKMPADYGRDNYNHINAEFIESKGLEYGYATFWNCQTITLLSDSSVKCREIMTSVSKGVYTDYYQSSRRWYVGQDYDRYFVLLSDSELNNVYATSTWLEWTSEYLLESYTVDDGLAEGYNLFVFSVNVLEFTVN